MDIAKRLIFLLCLVLFCGQVAAFGRSVPAVQAGWQCGTGTGGSPYAACLKDWLADSSGKTINTPMSCGTPSNGLSNCSGAYHLPGYGSFAWGKQAKSANVSMCPANSTETPTKLCECNQGFKPSAAGNSCTPYSCPAKGSYTAVTQPDRKIENPGVQCMDGCNVNPASVKSAPDGSLYMSWPYKYTGDVCGGKVGGDGVNTGETSTEAPKQCPSGQCPGSVNGLDVCVACVSTTIPGASSSASGAAGAAGSNLPDGATSATNTTCNQSTCTTTTTVTDKNGSVLGTATQEKPKENFCQENPGLQICKEGRWGGNCGGGYTCDGDAVQCALAREVHTRNCQLYDTPNELSDIGSAAMNSQAVPDGHPGKNPESKNFASMFRPMEGNAACIPDKTVSLAGKSVVLPFSQVCDPLRWMGHIAFAFALVHAAFFVFRKL